MPIFINKSLRRKNLSPRKFVTSFGAKASVKVQEATEDSAVADKKNKETKKEKAMNDNIEKLKKIVGADADIPDRKTKKVKKNNGLIERTENSTILITEDNKMILND